MDNSATSFWRIFWVRGLSLFFLCLIFALYIFSVKPAVDVQAQKAFFYSDTCLGGWQLSKNASGAPDALSDLRYTDDNSAVFNDGNSAIFCGDFKGELPPQTYQTRVSLRFSWKQDIEEVLIIEESTFLDSIVDIFSDEEESDSAPENSDVKTNVDIATSSSDLIQDESTTTLNIIDNEATSTNIDADNSTDESTIDDVNLDGDLLDKESEESVQDFDTNQESEPVEEVNPDPEPVEESESTEVPEPEPVTESGDEVSWLKALVPTVYAEELSTITDEYSSTSDASLTEDETDIISDTDDAIFAVEYTTDGLVWNNVGYVATINNDVRFEIPNEVLNNIAGVENMQIALRPMLSYDFVAPIYLDSMWLEVSYAPIRELGVHAVSGIVPEKVKFDDFFGSENIINASTTWTGISIDNFLASSTLLYGLDNRHVLAGLNYQEATELWLLDLDLEEIRRIGFAEASIGNYPVAAKDGIVFWLNFDASIIFSYDLRTGGVLREMALVGNLPELDDKIFTFPFTDWQVIWRADEFYFYKDTPGEVFRDENALAVDRLGVYFDKKKQIILDGESTISASSTLSSTTESVLDGSSSTTNDPIIIEEDIETQNENI